MTALSRPSPQAAYWTYADLAREFGHGVDWWKRNMRQFEKAGFPAPVPWWRREKRWAVEPVRRWMREQEQRAGSHGAPHLRLVSGGLS